jgi:hypothetical protein
MDRPDPAAEPGWWQPYAAMFPAWHAWQGVNDLYYARQPGSSPPRWVRGTDPAELPGLIRALPKPWWAQLMRTEEPTAAGIERDYPHWRTWAGSDGLCHGLRTQGAALAADGKDWGDVADQIRRAEAMLEDVPEAWRR